MNNIAGLILLIALQLHVVALAQTRKPIIQKEPAWVTHTTINYNSSNLDNEAEDGYINLDYEKQVSLPQQSVYTRTAIKILSESGVQNSSEINVSFDPSYSQLIFHTITIIRGNEIINKLEPAKMNIIQQENDLSRYVYNGSLSAILILEDVRKGDIIEYSYTIKGFNPVFKGRYAGIFETNFSVPVYNMYYKLLAPEEKVMQIKNNLTDISYTKTKTGNQIAYEWKLNNVPGIDEQDYTPSWYDPYSWVMVSEYQSWKEVNDWARTLFPYNIPLSPVLKNKINELNTKYLSPESRILAALRFVQDDVRYMGIEMGPRSHKPHDPNKIIAQRFGDCKDKSYLLCMLLRGVGIEASPVLINTGTRKALFNMLPSPGAFDHATVRVSLNGRHYWFDPTIAYQRGSLDAISYPDYQCGLIIHDTTTSLTTIPLQNKGRVNVREVFDIPDMSGKARLKVKTTFTGSYADEARELFNSNSKSEIKEDYKDFYAQYFEKIEADSVSYTDDEATGQITVNEYYSIRDLWELKEGVKKCYFSPFVINGAIKNPKDQRRSMPIAVVYPAKYQEEIVINVPKDWSSDESLEDVNCSAFKLRAQFAYLDRQFKLKYEYESLKDHVLPKESEAYFDKLKKIDDELSYSLSQSDNPLVSDETVAKSQRNSRNAGYVITLVMALIGVTIWWTQRRK